MPNAIEVSRVSKKYQLYERPFDRLKEMILRRPFHREFWALRDVDLTVPRGRTVGLVGQNGSGKSTILQIVAGTLQPTTGSVRVDGRVSALLELGSGFNPEFSGRENVFINGAILGMSRREMERRFDEIAAFAEIGDFIDHPVKTYSTGMAMRLAFAIAIHVDPDVLIVDEALAVGDMAFQMRCFRKIREARERGVTILLVSHDLDAVRELCDEALLVADGIVTDRGKPDAIAKQYTEYVMSERKEQLVERRVDRQSGPSRHGNHEAELVHLHLASADWKVGPGEKALIHAGDRLEVAVRVRANVAVPDAIVGIAIRNRIGLNVFGTNTERLGQPLGPVAAGEEAEVRFQLACNLVAAPYSITVAVHSDRVSHDWQDDALVFEVVGTPHSVGIAHMAPAVEAVRIAAQGV